MFYSKNINIVIVGAAAYNLPTNKIKYWNNVYQASHFQMYSLVNKLIAKGCNVNVTCVDPNYPYNASIKSMFIDYKNDYFDVKNPIYLKHNAHNIVIEFCNLITESWCTFRNSPGLERLEKFKITFISCGATWSYSLPHKCIENVIENNLFTPLHVNKVQSLQVIISNVNKIRKQVLYNVMIPYLRGCLQVMGTFTYRGYELDYSTEEIIREFIPSMSPYFSNEVNPFLLKNIHWNNVPMNIKEQLSIIVFGANEKYINSYTLSKK